jgi:hypothetical protein
VFGSTWLKYVLLPDTTLTEYVAPTVLIGAAWTTKLARSVSPGLLVEGEYAVKLDD